ncbi:MAG: type II toxin-antitoxin system RatA family toxin [Gammaproteobacteria bacterium]|nr:type II toxin-antitoxin system RatA family toxin [Gammaproteobacteria bacterium]
MHKINQSQIVPYPQKAMFELVDDVDRYQDFLPWCGGSGEIERTDSTVTAFVSIAFKGLRKSFTTRNTLTKYNLISMELIDGPFRELSGEWRFTVIDDHSCKVSLNLDFEVSGGFIEKLMTPLFLGICESMVKSFCRRADELYGSDK